MARDPATDIALLHIDAKGLTAAVLGDSDKLEVGEWVVAIGEPYGLSSTVTAGIVSAKGRRGDQLGGFNNGYWDFIQTDAAINPGNSGGPLYNMRGEVVGINTAINARAQGLAFAVPIDMAKRDVADFKKYGRVQRGWLGIRPIDPARRRRRAVDGGAGRHRRAGIAGGQGGRRARRHHLEVRRRLPSTTPSGCAGCRPTPASARRSRCTSSAAAAKPTSR